MSENIIVLDQREKIIVLDNEDDKVLVIPETCYLGAPDTIEFNGVYTTPTGNVSGNSAQDWVNLHFASINPNISISATPSFALFETGETISNPIINGNATLGGNPAGTFALMEFFRGATLFDSENNPSANTAKTDSFAVIADQEYSVKITDSEGRTASKSNSYIFTLPVFATTANILTMTKQSLKVKTSNYFSADMVAENDNGDKQTYDHPLSFSAVTGIQFFNTVSNAWEWLSGSKSNSLTNFATTATIRTVQGNIVDYTRYTNNSSKIGARKLRFYTN